MLNASQYLKLMYVLSSLRYFVMFVINSFSSKSYNRFGVPFSFDNI